MTNSISRFFNTLDLPKIILIGGLWWYRKKLPIVGDVFLSEEEKANKKLAKGIQDMDVNKANLTHQPSAYLTFASQIFTASDGYGTTESTIVDVFNKMLTKDDVVMLAKAYGIRTTTTNWISDGAMPLPGVLRSELEEADYPDIFAKLAAAGF